MIDYEATAENVWAEIERLTDRHDRYGQSLAFHGANFRDVAKGRMTDHGADDHMFRQSERFLRLHGLLVERA